jgi:MFS family permease
MLGLGGHLQVEVMFYYYFTFFLIGLFSSILWPSMIHILGNWFSKTNRGLIVGAWATCANIGNIIGIQIAAILIKAFKQQWQYLLFINALLMGFYAVLILLFLVPHPSRIGLVIQENDPQIKERPVEERPLGTGLPQSDGEGDNHGNMVVIADEVNEEMTNERVSFWKAWLIPRVFLYSATLFCVKLATNSMLLWLPLLL